MGGRASLVAAREHRNAGDLHRASDRFHSIDSARPCPGMPAVSPSHRCRLSACLLGSLVARPAEPMFWTRCGPNRFGNARRRSEIEWCDGYGVYRFYSEALVERSTLPIVRTVL